MKTFAYQIMPARCKKSVLLPQAKKEWTEVSKNYVYEIKEDGNRYLLQIRPNGSKINYLTSRRISKVTGVHVEKQDKLPQVRDSIEFHGVKNIKGSGFFDTIFDGEWIGGSDSIATAHEIAEGRGTFVAWDVLMVMGVDLTQMPLSARKTRLDALSEYFPSWMRLIKQFSDPKKALKYVEMKGLEGLVRKELDKPYGVGWTKAKKVAHYDVVIYGYEETKSEDWAKKKWIGALLVGQWKERKSVPMKDCYSPYDVPVKLGAVYKLDKKFFQFVQVGKVSGFTQELRQKFSAKRDTHIGQVIEIECDNRLPSGFFWHPRFERLRYDKNHFECLFSAPKTKEGE